MTGRTRPPLKCNPATTRWPHTAPRVTAPPVAGGREVVARRASFHPVALTRARPAHVPEERPAS